MVDRKFFDETISMILFIVGVGLMFLGICLSVWPDESTILLSISLFIICAGVGLMIITALAQNEGFLGLIFGILIALSITAFMLIPFVGTLSWLPINNLTYTILFSIAIPLILGGGGGAVTVRFFIVFI